MLMSVAPRPENHAALLMAIAQRQDRQAFATLFHAYAPRLKAWLQRGGAEPNQAEEMAQETMLAVWRKAGMYDPARSEPGTWIFAIARNLRLDALRRARLAVEEPEDTHPVALADAILATEQRAQRLRDAITQLPAEQAEALHLAFFEEFSHSRMEARLGVPLGTVKSRLRLAMARLRIALQDRI
ncbi:sigma-70 family RNA polymerase sigma factor [Roseomonas aerophila]|uniref:Sigma-70 family RNA polymerase sigma factor n=2 Tax=Teichococcus aerophilus TaxID=1224513 RepID=A0ABR7RH60_9PROT|nr:sigma-70 family RNA polymerase sigma factor [Pseudoroseomonas aerophila]